MSPATATPNVQAVKRAVLYLRVSTPRQMETAIDIDADGNSIATQRDLTQRRARNLNASIEHEFIEPGNSAQTIEKRPIFRSMLSYLAEHPEIDYVIIYMRSRAFRNFADAAITKRQLGLLGVKLVSAKEDFGEGYMADAMEAVTDIFNEIEVRRNGEDIKVKLQHKAMNGGTISRAKIGYLNIRADINGRLVNTIGLDPQRAPLVCIAFQLYATGDYSLKALSLIMADRGLMTRPSPKRPTKPLDTETLRRTLADPYYTGVMVYKGEVVPGRGRHEAIVSIELFDQVQEVLDRRSRRGQRDRVLQHYLKGMLFCGRCQNRDNTESRLIYTEATGRNAVRYGYFLCRGRQDGICDLPHLPASLVEEAICLNYRTLDVGLDFVSEIREQLSEVMTDQQRLTTELHARLTKQLTELDLREDRLLDLAADGALSKAKIQQRVNTLRLERRRIQDGLADTGAELAIGAERLKQCLQLVSDPAQLYAHAPDTTRRSMNQTFYDRFYIDEEQQIAVTSGVLRPPFDEIRSAARVYQQRQQGPQTTLVAGAQAERTVEQKPETPVLADVFLVGGSSKRVLVGVAGIEPATARV